MLLDRKRFAHDFGAGGAEATGEVPSAVACLSSELSTTAVTSSFSADEGAGSESFVWVEAIESLCDLRAAVGLGGRRGTAGRTGPARRAFGCVGVCWDFADVAPAAEAMELGCVETASEGVSDGKGVDTSDVVGSVDGISPGSTSSRTSSVSVGDAATGSGAG